jgi:hypothetical protein
MEQDLFNELWYVKVRIDRVVGHDSDDGGWEQD